MDGLVPGSSAAGPMDGGRLCGHRVVRTGSSVSAALCSPVRMLQKLKSTKAKEEETEEELKECSDLDASIYLNTL